MQTKNKFAKKAVAFSMSCMMAVTAFGTPSFGSVSAAGLTADQITEEMKIGWNIGNSLDSVPKTSDVATHETAWGNPKVTQELIDAVKAKGFNTVRVPTTWYPHVTESNGTYTIDPAWLARVKEVVDYCYNNDMYVILNVHHEEWINRAD
ncbi:MAG: cellulase family glycosylhydrolase, partial [Oscillospiraceae bacterium]|nr:cellulase family glycosylhydrolase [Oscillospiraceae bacterium]